LRAAPTKPVQNDSEEEQPVNTNTISKPDITLPSLEGVRARTLAYVNFGLFRELIKRGTSRERICTTLCLNHSEYDYLAHLQ
jgi:hypothetical protein